MTIPPISFNFPNMERRKGRGGRKRTAATGNTESEIERAEHNLRRLLYEISQRDKIQSQIGEAFYVWRDDPSVLVEDLEEQLDEITFTRFFDWFLFDFRLLDSGRRIVEIMAEDEAPTLSPLEAKMASLWKRATHSFFELKETDRNAGRIVLEDLFRGELYEVTDSSTASSATPPDIVSARPLPVGDRHYFSGVVTIYPPNFKPIILEYFNEEYASFRQLRGEAATVGEFLRDWGFYIENRLRRMVDDPRYVTAEGEEIVFHSARYRMRDPTSVVSTLEKTQNVRRIVGGGEEAVFYSLLDEGGKRVIGTVEIEGDVLTVECHSRSLAAKAWSFFEGLMGEELQLIDRTKKEPSAYRVGGVKKTAAGGGRRLPPGARSQKEVEAALIEYYRRWVDEPHAALGGKTPRQCAASERDRPKLLKLLRELESLYESARGRGEPYFDVKTIFEELRIKGH